MASVNGPVVGDVPSAGPSDENPVVGELMIPGELLVGPAGLLEVVIVILGWVIEPATLDVVTAILGWVGPVAAIH